MEAGCADGSTDVEAAAWSSRLAEQGDHVKIARRVAVLSMLAIALGQGTAIVAQERLPLIDAHNHLVPGLSAETIVGLMDQAGVQRTVLMANRIERSRPLGWEDDLVLEVHSKYPQRIIPFLTTVRFRSGGVAGKESASFVEYADWQLTTGKFRGMGEFMVRHFAIETSDRATAAPDVSEPADSPHMQEMMRLGAKHGVPLVFHMETTPDSVEALDRALSANPKTKVIWAHQNPLKMDGGASAQYARQAEPGQIAAMLEKHPNLYADISIGYETRFLRPQDRDLPQNWKALYEKYNDRFVVGLDLAVNPMWDKGYLPRTNLLRAWLSQLRSGTARKIAFENMDRLLASKP